MATKEYDKTRVDSELQDIKKKFPDFDNTQLIAEYSPSGEILRLETDDVNLQTVMKNNGFKEKIK